MSCKVRWELCSMLFCLQDPSWKISHWRESFWKGNAGHVYHSYMLLHGGVTTLFWTRHTPASSAPHEEVGNLGHLCAQNDRRTGFSYCTDPNVKLHLNFKHLPKKAKISDKKKWPSQANISRKDLSSQTKLKNYSNSSLLKAISFLKFMKFGKTEITGNLVFG